jgi:hypothetical protein
VSVQEAVDFARRLAAGGSLDTEQIIQKTLDHSLEDQPFNNTDEVALEGQLRNHLLGYGALQPLIDDDSIEEIWINGPESRLRCPYQLALASCGQLSNACFNAPADG